MAGTSHANIKFRIMKQAVAAVGLRGFLVKNVTVSYINSITKILESSEES